MLERAGVGTLMIGDGSSQAVTSPSFDGNLQLLHGGKLGHNCLRENQHEAFEND